MHKERTVMRTLPHVNRRALAGIALIAGMTAGIAFSIPQPAAGGSIANKNVQVVNLSDQSFGVIWTTPASQTGSTLEYGRSCAATTAAATETLGLGFAHLVNTPGGLNPGTTYYFKLVVGGTVDNNSGNCYTATTYKTQSIPPPPAAAYGHVEVSSCKTPLSGALITMAVSHNGAFSASLATITDTLGSFALPFGDVTNAAGVFRGPVKGDTIRYIAYPGGASPITKTVTYDGATQVLNLNSVCAS
jgi:hypothetical protein